MSKPRLTLSPPRRNDGLRNIRIYFRHRGNIIRYGLDTYVKVEDWDPEQQQIKPRKVKGKEDQAIKSQNQTLVMKLSRAMQIKADYEFEDQVLDNRKFREEMEQSASRTDFLEFFEATMIRLYNRRVFGIEELKQEQRTLKRLRRYQPKLLFSQINRRWVEEFDEWHAKDQAARGHDGLRERERSLKLIQKYLLKAKSENKKFSNPFEGFDWPRWQAKEIWLEPKEVAELLFLFRNPSELQKRMRGDAEDRKLRPFDVTRYCSEKMVELMREYLRCLLVSCFTGMRYSDLVRIQHKDHIKDNTLEFTPKKTKDTSGKKVIMPLTEIHHELFRSDIATIVMPVSNQKYNKQLKVIARLSKIRKNLTTHIGRHTFGSMLGEAGVSPKSMMDLMGVTNVETVMIYIHSSLEQQRREMTRVHKQYKKV